MFSRSTTFLRFEGVLLLPISLGIFAQTNRPWWWIALALIAPDLLLTKRVHEHAVGKWFYDAFHTYPLPAILTVVAVLTAPNFDSPQSAIAMAWFAHIGLDRLLGRGACYAGRVVDDLYERADDLLRARSEMMHLKADE